MRRLLELIWDGCWHKWATDGSGNYRQNSDFGGHRDGYYFVQHCERCGKHRLEKAL